MKKNSFGYVQLLLLKLVNLPLRFKRRKKRDLADLLKMFVMCHCSCCCCRLQWWWSSIELSGWLTLTGISRVLLSRTPPPACEVIAPGSYAERGKLQRPPQHRRLPLYRSVTARPPALQKWKIFWKFKGQQLKWWIIVMQEPLSIWIG